MDPRFAELQLQLEHRHNDGSWGRLKRHHTSVEHDPERDWGRGQIYQCTSCDELVRVTPGQEADPDHH
jgi:hypothetical protein